MRNDNWAECDDNCFSCLIRTPQSSYHCLNCRCCVSKVQFHLSPWKFGLCIGQLNFPIYFFFSFFRLLCWFTYSICVLYSIEETTRTPFPVSLVEQWFVLFSYCKLSAFIIILMIFRSADVVYDLIVMFSGICQGMTVHELRHMHLYTYLFDIVKNRENKTIYVHKN